MQVTQNENHPTRVCTGLQRPITNSTHYVIYFGNVCVILRLASPKQIYSNIHDVTLRYVGPVFPPYAPTLSTSSNPPTTTTHANHDRITFPYGMAENIFESSNPTSFPRRIYWAKLYGGSPLRRSGSTPVFFGSYLHWHRCVIPAELDCIRLEIDERLCLVERYSDPLFLF